MFAPNAICLLVLNHIFKPVLWPNLSTQATTYFSLQMMEIRLRRFFPASKWKQFKPLWSFAEIGSFAGRKLSA